MLSAELYSCRACSTTGGRKRAKLTGHHYQAFTLVELLMVIAVIAALAGIIFPIMAAARENARKTACASNLQQLHRAYALYASDYNGYVPPYQNALDVYLYEERIHVPARATEMVASLHPYIRSRAVWFCPSDIFAGTNADRPSQLGRIDHRYTSYMPTSLLWEALAKGKPLTMDPTLTRSDGKVLGASELVLLTDGLWSCYSPAEIESGAILPPYSHNDRFNAVHFDGHVKSRSVYCGQ